MNIGHDIINAIIDSNLIMEVLIHEDGTTTFVWSASAVEQLEALICDKLQVRPSDTPP